MNLPNKLSLARIVAVPFFFLFVFGGDVFYGPDAHLPAGIFRAVALVLVIAVTVTDWLDGKIARERKIETNLGKLLDPLADKIFVAAALVALVELRLVPAWAVILVIGREFLVTGLRSLALECGRLIAADRLGKHKTGWQLGFIITAMTILTARDFLQAADVWKAPLVSQYRADLIFTGMLWFPLTVALVLTALSGANYLKANWDLFKGQL